MALELRLNRIDRAQTYTGGELYVQQADGWVKILSTLEDRIRELGPHGENKVWGDTAILPGRYQLQKHWSPGLNRFVPMLLKVLYFGLVYLHIGNSTNDTHGCILVGLCRNGDFLKQSRDGFELLMHHIEQAWATGQEVWLTIENN